jgi:uncharacterized protein YjiS (DUF1127 family)
MPISLAQRSVPSVGRSSAKHTLSDTHSSTLSTAVCTLATWIVRGGQRKALGELAQDARLLNDVGLSREQALREAAKPFWRR